ncbi:hypothetical protein CIHG_07347 [Coccidioides immitis H538.4]|uniref:Uncharacterized protein n=2 Tax=Coccidioides immitis TaxID=5501 RepID=A0A0J8RWJ4_COCIT|nr:hypothetical protein CIRG_00677 [Coccidioides immitis RMSCC 2394]KMU89540.1 hypothetical protein CIHG_07347 [Coccidioides immitis H538.4]
MWGERAPYFKTILPMEETIIRPSSERQIRLGVLSALEALDAGSIAATYCEPTEGVSTRRIQAPENRSKLNSGGAPHLSLSGLRSHHGILMVTLGFTLSRGATATVLTRNHVSCLDDLRHFVSTRMQHSPSLYATRMATFAELLPGAGKLLHCGPASAVLGSGGD